MNYALTQYMFEDLMSRGTVFDYCWKINNPVEEDEEEKEHFHRAPSLSALLDDFKTKYLNTAISLYAKTSDPSPRGFDKDEAAGLFKATYSINFFRTQTSSEYRYGAMHRFVYLEYAPTLPADCGWPADFSNALKDAGVTPELLGAFIGPDYEYFQAQLREAMENQGIHSSDFIINNKTIATIRST